MNGVKKTQLSHTSFRSVLPGASGVSLAAFVMASQVSGTWDLNHKCCGIAGRLMLSCSSVVS